MTLDELVTVVSHSDAEEWHKVEKQTVYGWEWGTNQGAPYIEPKTHETLAVYKPDVDITLVFGAKVNDFEESWVRNFPDGKAYSACMELRYRGVVVYEWVFVAVDGARYAIIMPEISGGGGMPVDPAKIKFTMPKAKQRIGQLIFDLWGAGGVHDSLPDVCKRAGITLD